MAAADRLKFTRHSRCRLNTGLVFVEFPHFRLTINAGSTDRSDVFPHPHPIDLGMLLREGSSYWKTITRLLYCAGINEICRIFQWPWYWCSSSAGRPFTRSASCSSLSRSTTIGRPASAALTTSSTWPRVRHPSHKMKISSSSRPFLLCASYEPPSPLPACTT